MIPYYVFETMIGDTVVTDATHAYRDNYTVKVPRGTYTVNIQLNGQGGQTPDRIIINNSYVADPVGPVVPGGGGDTPTIPGDPSTPGTPGTNPVTPGVLRTTYQDSSFTSISTST